MIICKQHDVNLNDFKYKFSLIAILQMTQARAYFLTLFRTEKIVFLHRLHTFKSFRGTCEIPH